MVVRRWPRSTIGWVLLAGSALTVAGLADTLKVALQLDRDQQLSPTKNKTSGAIDLSDAMVEELSEHLKRSGLVGAGSSTLNFSTAKAHRPLRYSNWRARGWVAACQQAGLAGFTSTRTLDPDAFTAPLLPRSKGGRSRTEIGRAEITARAG